MLAVAPNAPHLENATMTDVAAESAVLDELNAAIQDIFVLSKPTSVTGVLQRSLETLLATRYQLILLNQPTSDQRELAFLAPSFREAAHRGAKGLAASTLGVPPEGGNGPSLRTRAIAAALATGEYRLLSPFSGQAERVGSSLGLEWYFHRLGEHVCLASQMGDTAIAVNLETVWVFPKNQLILHIANGLPDNLILQHIAAMLRRCLSNSARIVAYLNAENAGRAIAVTDFSCPHMSHNLWNIQTAWANVLTSPDLAKITRFLCYKNQDFFGSLEDLYCDRLPLHAEIIEVVNDDDVFSKMIDYNLFLFTVKDEFFTQNLTRRIVDRARRVCSKEFLEFVDGIKSDPLVITTIRLDNRAWIEQEAGIPALFRRLKNDFNNIGFILDGLSSDTARGWTTGWMSMEAELRVVDKIQRSLGDDFPLYISVGRNFAESLVFIEAADLFIAPSGSGMALYKWLCNMPGVAFSNRTVLDHANPTGWPLRVWHNSSFRSDLVPTLHLSPDLVTDGDVKRNHVTRADFHLDWQHIYEVAVPLIRQVLRSTRRTTRKI